MRKGWKPHDADTPSGSLRLGAIIIIAWPHGSLHNKTPAAFRVSVWRSRRLPLALNAQHDYTDRKIFLQIPQSRGKHWCMKRALLSLCFAFSLLLTPIAHAFSVGCEGDNAQMSEQVKKESKSEQQKENDKMAKVLDHCSCSHVSARTNLASAAPITISSRIVFAFEQDAMSSIVAGPPLKPPSHA